MVFPVHPEPTEVEEIPDPPVHVVLEVLMDRNITFFYHLFLSPPGVYDVLRVLLHVLDRTVIFTESTERVQRLRLPECTITQKTSVPRKTSVLIT